MADIPVAVNCSANSSMTCLTHYAHELLEYIFCSPELNYEDVINLSKTCQRFASVCRSNEIWKCMMYRRWTPKLQGPLKEDDVLKNVFTERYLIEKCLIKRLADLAEVTFDYDEVPYVLLHEFKDMYSSSDTEKLFTILDILFMFIDIDQEDSLGDINRQYYARKVYRYLYHDNLKKQWDELLNSHVDNAAHIEKGAILIAQWCNPEARIMVPSITNQLDSIANLVRKVLPADSQDSLQMTYANAVNVIKAMNQVIYEDLGFKGNMSSYYDIENSYIHKVLERRLGIPISLAVLYISVARRLGLHMQGINFPGHFLLRIMINKRNDSQVFVDVFNNGKLLNDNQCIEQFVSSINRFHWPKEMMFQVADKRKLFIRILNNIIHVLKESADLNSQKLPDLCTAHELMHIFDPTDEENTLLLSRIYLHQGINLEDVASRFHEMFSNYGVHSYSILLDALNAAKSKKEPKVIYSKYRSHPENVNVEFRVGAIVEHKRFSYRCVIYGWDPVCRMDDGWQAQMGVHRLQDKDEQPFYHVLADDGSSRYAAQESLHLSAVTSPISNLNVGKYFKSFTSDHYVFTEKLSEAYPEDEIIDN